MIALGHYSQIMSNTSQLVNLGITALTSDYEDIFGPFFHVSLTPGYIICNDQKNDWFGVEFPA